LPLHHPFILTMKLLNVICLNYEDFLYIVLDSSIGFGHRVERDGSSCMHLMTHWQFYDWQGFAFATTDTLPGL